MDDKDNIKETNINNLISNPICQSLFENNITNNRLKTNNKENIK